MELYVRARGEFSYLRFDHRDLGGASVQLEPVEPDAGPAGPDLPSQGGGEQLVSRILVHLVLDQGIVEHDEAHQSHSDLGLWRHVGRPEARLGGLGIGVEPDRYGLPQVESLQPGGGGTHDHLIRPTRVGHTTCHRGDSVLVEVKAVGTGDGVIVVGLIRLTDRLLVLIMPPDGRRCGGQLRIERG